MAYTLLYIRKDALKVIPYFFSYKTSLFHQNNAENLDSSYKMGLDLWDFLGKVKLVSQQSFMSYSQINTVISSLFLKVISYSFCFYMEATKLYITLTLNTGTV